MDESKLELKVGALVLAALAGALALFWLMGEITFGASRPLAVDFSHPGNVVRGAPVKLGGFQVGRVDGVDLLPQRHDALGLPMPVTLKLSLTSDAFSALKRDVTVTVSSQGPLGEPYLELN